MAKRCDARAQTLDDVLVDAFRNEQARAGAADVSLVEVDRLDDSLDGLIEGGVFVHDQGGLPAEFERKPKRLAGRLSTDRLADLGRAGK